jgi:hypothetical protein
MSIIDLIKETKNYNEFIKKIESTNIKIKDKLNSDLVLLYTDFMTNSYELEIEESCRNIIIDKNSLGIVAYGQPKIKYNDYCTVSELQLSEAPKVITESIEGTLLMLYYYKDEWCVSTRKTINANESFWKSTKSHCDLFKESINDWDKFLELHDSNRIYLYVLVHHENKNLIDYTNRFGNEYKKIFFVLSRDKTDFTVQFVYNLVNQEFDYNEHKFKENTILDFINLPIKYEDYSILDEQNINEENMDNIESIELTSNIAIINDLNSKNITSDKLKSEEITSLISSYL